MKIEHSGIGIRTEKDDHPDKEKKIHQVPEKVLMDNHLPPPIPARLVEAPLLVEGEQLAVLSTTRAGDSADEMRSSDNEREGAFGQIFHPYITVKGVALSGRQMKGRDDTDKKTASAKKVKKTGAVKKDLTATPPSNKIWNYFGKKKADGEEMKVRHTSTTAGDNKKIQSPSYVRKTVRSVGDEETDVLKNKNVKDNMVKTTFTGISPGGKGVKKKIENFMKITNDNDRCLFGSGRCANHNTRLQRVVKNKKVSVVNKDGTIGWKTCEVTTLVCPAVNSDASKVSVGGDSLSDEGAGRSANKKARFLMQNVNNQPDLSPTMM